MPHISSRFQSIRRFARGACLVGAPLCRRRQITFSAKPNPPPFKLGMVTYNMAAKWDVPTILKVCKRLESGQ